MRFSPLILLLATAVYGCEDCYGSQWNHAHARNVRRMQPDAQGAVVKPRGPLRWGQLNFLHTTDTHGWLEGHLKEQNYGADWGDFVSFTRYDCTRTIQFCSDVDFAMWYRHMKQKACDLGVDLLLVDTGDLHDGAGLSDATAPNGLVSNPIFEQVDYDLLTIGNHELYVTDVAYLTFNGFSKVYGDRYVTSNVQIKNPSTGEFEHVGSRYRYFTTRQGIRIMAFGVLYDFTGNSNVSKVIKAADLVKESWFLSAIKYERPIDIFVIIGHNPVRATDNTSTLGLIYQTIRELRPNVPIQAFGGHTHIRDFTIYDEISTGLESGRYCETLGWLSLSGINSSTFVGNLKPRGVPNPTQRAIKAPDGSQSATATVPSSTSNMVYSRRYLDWNRLTFGYHASKSQGSTFDFRSGLEVTKEINAARKALNLTVLYGCAPETYCQFCKPFLARGNIFGLVQEALALTVVNASRADIPRLIIINTGSIRFDLVQGPFTLDDSFIVSPFKDAFQFIPDVPYAIANKVLDIFNAGPLQKRDGVESHEFGSVPLLGDICTEDALSRDRHLVTQMPTLMTRGLHRRPTSYLNPGYTTSDDFGTDGDDTPHSPIPKYPQPNDVQANASFPTDGTLPKTVDFIFFDFLTTKYVLPVLQRLGANYTIDDVQDYLPRTFTSSDYLPAYAKLKWQKNVPNCPVESETGN